MLPDQLICGGVIKVSEGRKKRRRFFFHSSGCHGYLPRGPTFVKPSLRMYEYGETRDNFDVHATTSDLTLKISSFSKDIVPPRTPKPKGDPRHIRSFFCFLLFCFLAEGGRRKTSRMPSDTSCGGFGYNAAEGTTELLMSVSLHTAPSAL